MRDLYSEYFEKGKDVAEKVKAEVGAEEAPTVHSVAEALERLGRLPDAAT